MADPSDMQHRRQPALNEDQEPTRVEFLQLFGIQIEQTARTQELERGLAFGEDGHVEDDVLHAKVVDGEVQDMVEAELVAMFAILLGQLDNQTPTAIQADAINVQIMHTARFINGRWLSSHSTTFPLQASLRHVGLAREMFKTLRGTCRRGLGADSQIA